jgi:hypothetical protein
MSVVLLLGLFFGYAFLVRPIVTLPMSPGLLLAAQIVLGIGAFVIPLLAFSAIDRAWWKMHVGRVAKQWCASAGITFQRAELHKNHFTAVGAAEQGKIRRRFRMSRYFFLWKVKKIEWLDPDVTAVAATALPDTSPKRERDARPNR